MSNDVFKHARKRGHSVVENALLDDFNLTGMAKYLLIQFCSHREGVWKVTMPDIIKRSKNGRDAHYKALKELIHNKYVARVKVLDNGKHKEQIYIYGQIKEDVAEMLEETLQELKTQGYAVRIEFGNPLTENPNVEIPDSDFQYNIKYQRKNTNKENTNISIQDIVKFDDDKRSFPSLSEKHLNLIVNTLREATNDELTDRSFKSVLRKVMDKYNQGKISNFRDYFITALVNKIEELDLRRTKENAKKQLQEDKLNRNIILQSLSTHEYTGKIPFYNWLGS
ncbi:TPA: hypothetical protein QCW30_005046 [Bacillus cereus]|uniref:hypothetical protein n=1 Tax=Bacillus cereus group TaxID=86661 RepID=UPI0007F963D3|nr:MULTISPECIES: hypothetical protein [Bacillus cereus group]ARV91080.1 hypothetical protein BJG91_01780 [Bacillus thuringiensis]MCC2364003.1 hypothetical protein [Bacillus cereus]MEB9660331.1 hypothetical protein [Bacillus cereus]MRB36663.1 hypothetical protein [Bacillus thuringiensis]OTY27800.1 hypothetical protein BK738_11890 [Bacillus thuringiensis serovar rongseni]